MSETVKQTADARDADWIQRNADVVNIDGAREKASTAWTRAKENGGEAEVETVGGVGRYRVQLPDSDDEHDAILVKDAGGNWVGGCDCDGWMYNEWCAHLCTLAQRDVLDDPRIPQSNKLATSLLEGADDEPQPTDTSEPTQQQGLDSAVDVVDDTDDDQAGPEAFQDDNDIATVDDQDDEDVDEEPKTAKPVKSESADPNAAVEPQGSTCENTLSAGDSDAFAGKLPSMEGQDHLVMEMDGQPYIRRAGYARLAKSEDLRLELEEVVGAHDTDWTRSKYRATIRDPSGEIVATDVGSAHLDVEDMADAEANLDELAATRAACRALAWATGEGLTAVEEVAAEKAQRAGVK